MRLDQLLVTRKLAASRTQSQKMIQGGQVSVHLGGQWKILTKPSYKCEDFFEVRVALGEEQKYVSRAGLKLEGALKRTELSVAGRTVLDVGQSTGGFTDCLLQLGAARVVGIDVGRDQLSPQIREDERVTCIEKVNARELDAEQLLAASGVAEFDLIVMDVSFISQSLILPRLAPLLVDGGTLLTLVKPQFEVGVGGVGKGGIVKNPSLYAGVELKLREQVTGLGLTLRDYFDSPITGGDGNREFFIFAEKHMS